MTEKVEMHELFDEAIYDGFFLFAQMQQIEDLRINLRISRDHSFQQGCGKLNVNQQLFTSIR